MSKWGNRLMAAVDRANDNAVEHWKVKRAKADAAAERADARMDKADQERGHIYESKLKRSE